MVPGNSVHSGQGSDAPSRCPPGLQNTLLLPVAVDNPTFATATALPVLPAGGTVALYAQLCRTMGISPFGTMRMQDHKQVLAMKSGEWFT